VTIDRPTLLAAAITLALAVPVYQLIDWTLGPTFVRLAAWRAREAAPSLRTAVAVPEPAPDRAPALPTGEPAEVLPTARVEGVLHTVDGTPVSGETVELESGALGVRTAGTSDASGRFSIPNLPPGAAYELRVDSDGRYRSLVQSGLDVTAEGLSLDLVLEPLARARLTGRMVDPDGEPLPWRTLLLRASHVPALMLRVSSDERGDFRVDEAPTGRLTFTTPQVPHMQVQGPLLMPGAEADLELVLDEGGHELVGRVFGDRDAPIRGARLRLLWSHSQGDSISSSERTTVTDAAGAFRFTGLGSGPHELAVRAEGYHDATESVRVSRRTGDVELRLDPLPR
jgi:hypothetical protein